MLFKLLGMASLLFAFNQVYALEITEELILRSAQKIAPTLDEIQATLEAARVVSREANDTLKPTLFSGYNYLETREAALNEFMPVFSPIHQAELGLRQKTRYGAQLQARVAVDERSSASDLIDITDGTTTIVEFSAQLDLWKDLFGKLTRANLDSALYQKEQAKLQATIQRHSFSMTLRKLYWNLVSNNESLKVSEELLQKSIQQATEARKRLRSSVADRAEVAGYESQVASRKGQVLYLQFQREKTIEAIGRLLPEIKGQVLTLADYDLDKVVLEVLECTEIIKTQRAVPLQYTLYDEILELLKKVEKKQEIIDKSYDDIDFSLMAAARTTGVQNNGDLSTSIEDFQNNNRSGFEVGVNLSIPFGRGKTTSVKKELTRLQMRSQQERIDANLTSTHYQLNKSIELLKQVIAAERMNSEKLKERLKEMRKKYRQARVDVSTLIRDQDSLLNSELSVISVKTEILLTVIDYLTVFTQTPCTFNLRGQL